MKLTIKYKPNCKGRPWLLRRDHGEYSQHAHFYTKKEAVYCRNLIDTWQYPHCMKYKIAMQRLLSDKEFKTLSKKPKKGQVRK